MIKAFSLVKNFNFIYRMPNSNLNYKLLGYNSSDKPGSSSKNNKSNEYKQSHVDSKSDQQNLKNRQGVFIDEQRIKSKMKQIKERGQVKFEDQRKKKQEQFMKNYQINRGTSKVRKFRKDTDTQGLMNIEDVSLDQKPTILQVTAYSNKEIQVDGFPYPPSLVMSNNQLFVWELKQPEKMKVDHLKIVELINPPPEYVIIGCANPMQVPAEIRKYLQSLGMNYDIIQLFEAVSNFNTYSANDVRILAFLNSTKDLEPM